VRWSGDSRGWRGVAHRYREVHDDVARVEGAPMSGRRNVGCGGWSGHRGALGLSDVHGWVVRAGGQSMADDTSRCLR
jgi:hypothetical protein